MYRTRILWVRLDPWFGHDIFGQTGDLNFFFLRRWIVGSVDSWHNIRNVHGPWDVSFQYPSMGDWTGSSTAFSLRISEAFGLWHQSSVTKSAMVSHWLRVLLQIPHPKTNRTMEDPPWMKMYFLLKMGIFQCHGSFVGCTAAFSGRQLDFGASKLWNCSGFEGHLICCFTPNLTTTSAIYSRLAMFWTMSHWILWMSFGIIWKSSLWLKTTILLSSPHIIV